VTAERINDLLHSARIALEQESPNLLMVANALDQVERYMVWLYPPWVAKARINSILLQLEDLPIRGKSLLKNKLTELSQSDNKSDFGELRSVMDDAIGTINDQLVQDQIGRGLQINRLKSLRLWGLIVLAVFLIFSPFVTNIFEESGWPSQFLIDEPNIFFVWVNALAVALMGASGGFISGLLQAQSSKITLTEFLENMIKLQLRPLVGALLSLIIFSLLSWDVLPGISIESVGSYFIIAFLSGFSERYFLRLFDFKAENELPKGGSEQSLSVDEIQE
jgi:hypothetical protein